MNTATCMVSGKPKTFLTLVDRGDGKPSPLFFTGCPTSGIMATIMTHPTLSRYLRREIYAVFSLGLVVFTLVLLMGRMVKLLELVVSNGVPFFDVLYLLVLLIPSFLVLTIPMAFLLAVMVSFSRLSADNELTVMRASGIPLINLVPALLQVALPTATLTLLISLFVVPSSNNSFKLQSMLVAKKTVSTVIKEQMFRDDLPGLVVYVDQYDEASRRMQRVMIHDNRDIRRPLTIFADSGSLVAAGDNEVTRMVLERGTIHANNAEGYQMVSFGTYTLTMQADSSNAPKRKESEMALTEISAALNKPGLEPQRRAKLATEWHSRFAFPGAVIVFGLLAMPLGVTKQRSGKGAGFTISIAVILGYYMLLSFCKTLAEREAVAAGLAVWLPNLLFLLAGLLLLWYRVCEGRLPKAGTLISGRAHL